MCVCGQRQCFSDYSHIRPSVSSTTPAFLSLPMSMFKLFAQEQDIVNATQLLLMMALLCKGGEDVQDDRLGLCFDLLDVRCCMPFGLCC